MERLKQSLESLDEALFALESKVDTNAQTAADLRAREAKAVELVKHMATRLDQAIERVETLLQNP